jgi:DNA-binding PadR family transcriptional regulator
VTPPPSPLASSVYVEKTHRKEHDVGSKAHRSLTGFEHVLLGVIADEPRSGYGLKKMFSQTPASVYQPSPGALYPALRRLVARGLLRVEDTAAGGRARRVYHATPAGRAAHLAWLREPVAPASVGNDLGLHLMRFAMMERELPRREVLAFLESLASALSGFVSGMEKYVASGAQTSQHALLALEHGIAVHRASLAWTRSAIKALTPPPGDR